MRLSESTCNDCNVLIYLGPYQNVGFCFTHVENVFQRRKNNVKVYYGYGGAGMIGSNLVKRLVNDGWDVFVADNLWRGKLEYLNPTRS